uniref:Uncharacterized protein n=1 Tax=Globodera rostochiensis TaxID=31243 RepID=A0A914IDW6_GLORO
MFIIENSPEKSHLLKRKLFRIAQIDPPAVYKIILWDRFMRMFTSKSDKFFCMIQNIFAQKTLQRGNEQVIENTHNFLRHVIGNELLYRRCFQHVHTITTDENGQFLLKRDRRLDNHSSPRKQSFASEYGTCFCLPNEAIELQKGEGSISDETEELLNNYNVDDHDDDNDYETTNIIYYNVNIIPIQANGMPLFSAQTPLAALQKHNSSITWANFEQSFCLPYFADDPQQKCLIDFHSLAYRNQIVRNVLDRWLFSDKGPLILVADAFFIGAYARFLMNEIKAVCEGKGEMNSMVWAACFGPQVKGRKFRAASFGAANFGPQVSGPQNSGRKFRGHKFRAASFGPQVSGPQISGRKFRGRKIRAASFGATSFGPQVSGPQISGRKFRGRKFRAASFGAAKFGPHVSGRKLRAASYGPQISGRKFQGRKIRTAKFWKQLNLAQNRSVLSARIRLVADPNWFSEFCALDRHFLRTILYEEDAAQLIKDDFCAKWKQISESFNNTKIISVFHEWLLYNSGGTNDEKNDLVNEYLRRFSEQVPKLNQWKAMSKIDAELLDEIGNLFLKFLSNKKLENGIKKDTFSEVDRWTANICEHLKRLFASPNYNVGTFVSSCWEKLCAL